MVKQSYAEFLPRFTKSKKVVFTNGVFDLLHIGHIKYLKNASENGDCLIVGLNSNSSVKQLNKIGKRPIIDEIERAEILSCLYFVDLVIIFREKTPEKLIIDIKPDIYIKGGDYKIEDLPEAYIVKSYGGQVIPGFWVKGKSSTTIIAKLETSID